MSRELPSFDLVVATVGRTAELARFLDSVEAQEYSALRVLVVDQNEDERVADLRRDRSIVIERMSSARGLSRARNVGLRSVEADLVAFPDDDCAYPEGLLASVAARFAANPALDGLTGRAEDAGGHSSSSWKADAATLTQDNVWNRVNAATLFLRRELVERVGFFDERLGLGSGEPWSSGEEIDYLVRAVGAGGRIEYDPSLVVEHDVVADDTSIGYRDGATMGYLLRKHAYPARVVSRMLVRPLGGALLSLLRLDPSRARYHVATLRGRLRGYRTSSSNSSA